MSADRPSAFVTKLTGEGVGAIAVVRVWGPDAVAIASDAFRPRSAIGLQGTTPGRPRLGRMGAGLGDEVVALVVPADEQDRAGQPEVEVQCHGGPAAVELVISALTAAGALRRGAVAWLSRHGAAQVTVAARLDLTRATTLRAAAILGDQAAGALERELRRISEGVVEDAAVELTRLINRSAVGTRLLGGWTVVLAGRPNVGKSSLLNALAGFERAIVNASPGTTRDVVTAATALGGWPVELADTAGLRSSGEALEELGVALARERQSRADLVLLILDHSEPLTSDDRDLIRAHPGALIAANKHDLPAAWDLADPGRPDVVEVSAERGWGVQRLAEALANRLVPEPPDPGWAVPWRRAQVRRIERARLELAAGKGDSAWRAIGPLLGRRAPC